MHALSIFGLKFHVDRLGTRLLVLPWYASTVTYHEAKPAPTKRGKSVSYMDNEKQIQASQIQKAEEMLQFGNRKIAEGDQRGARRALESAYKLSQNDAAFNEDARVQLQKLKTQQAMMGINMRRSNFLMNSGVASQQTEQQQAAMLREARERQARLAAGGAQHGGGAAAAAASAAPARPAPAPAAADGPLDAIIEQVLTSACHWRCLGLLPGAQPEAVRKQFA